MTLSTLFLVLAVACVFWSVGAAIAITSYLDNRGLPTPFPLLRLYLFRNLSRYKELTQRETGAVGSLYSHYLIPIVAALFLAVTGLILRGAGI